jgi:beta-glucosidase
MKTKKSNSVLAAVVCLTNIMAQTTPLQLKLDNINEVISAMTLQEKVCILVGTGMSGVNIGMPVIGSTRSLVPGAAGTTYPIERIGIPAIVLADGPAGLRIDSVRDSDSEIYHCTHFPIGTSLASSWNTDIVYQVGKAIGEEVRDYGVDILLAPGNNIQRNPLCGRNFEYYSEDPVLSGNIAAAYIKGVQSNGVGTSLKHFCFNNQETKRMGNDAHMTQRAAREIYLKAFQIAIQKSMPWTVMSSYNKINGTFTSESHELLTTILRDEWGYKGSVVTDWFGGKDRVANINAGNDMLQPGLLSDPDSIMIAVKDGRISEKTLNTSVRRILKLIIKTPRFKGYKYNNEPDLKGHALMARNSAEEGTVLLKNNSMLPMDNRVKNVAVYGVTGYEIIPGGTGSGNVNRAYTISLIEGLRNNGYKTDEKLLEEYSDHLTNFRKEHANDKVDWWSGSARAREIIPMAKDLKIQASVNDVAIITIGRVSGEGVDRTAADFNLSKVEKQLILQVTDAFHKAGKKAVVLLNVGGVIETASWKDIPDAIILPWQCGQEGGNSMADVLSGKKNPSGKLPVTFPVNLMDHYSSKNMIMDGPNITMSVGKKDTNNNLKNIDYTNYEEDIYAGYRYFDTFNQNVSYPFGYGLSYTTFAYNKFSIILNGNKIIISVTITNAGNRAGKEIAEIYVKAPKGDIEKPLQELKAFAKTRELQPGESELLKMEINRIDLASFNENASAWIVDAGNYTFMVGASSRDIKDIATIKINGMKQKVNSVLKPQMKLNILKQK